MTQQEDGGPSLTEREQLIAEINRLRDQAKGFNGGVYSTKWWIETDVKVITGASKRLWHFFDWSHDVKRLQDPSDIITILCDFTRESPLRLGVDTHGQFVQHCVEEVIGNDCEVVFRYRFNWRKCRFLKEPMCDEWRTYFITDQENSELERIMKNLERTFGLLSIAA